MSVFKYLRSSAAAAFFAAIFTLFFSDSPAIAGEKLVQSPKYQFSLTLADRWVMTDSYETEDLTTYIVRFDDKEKVASGFFAALNVAAGKEAGFPTLERFLQEVELPWNYNRYAEDLGYTKVRETVKSEVTLGSGEHAIVWKDSLRINGHNRNVAVILVSGLPNETNWYYLFLGNAGGQYDQSEAIAELAGSLHLGTPTVVGQVIN